MSMYFLAQTKSKTIALQLPAVESESAQQSRCLQHDELQKKMQSKSENDQADQVVVSIFISSCFEFHPALGEAFQFAATTFSKHSRNHQLDEDAMSDGSCFPACTAEAQTKPKASKTLRS